jgi:hypothetical protein
VDALRMFRETDLVSIELQFSDRGQLPKSGRLTFQHFVKLRGRLFSDDFRVSGYAGSLNAERQASAQSPASVADST